jgi:hypothetical protein
MTWWWTIAPGSDARGGLQHCNAAGGSSGPRRDLRQPKETGFLTFSPYPVCYGEQPDRRKQTATMCDGESIVPEIPRLNGVIKALEEGKTAFVGFAPVDIESAAALASAPYDGIAFEMEHAPMSTPGLRDAPQHMLDRRRILGRGRLAPSVTPLVRIPQTVVR